MTFSNPLFDSNDDFTFSDDKSLSDEDVPEENVKIYSNPLFEFKNEYISSDVNPLFDEVLENIRVVRTLHCLSNLDESALLVTPLSDFNEDECSDPGGDVDEIEFLLRRDPSTPKMSVVSILEGFTDESHLEENDDLIFIEFFFLILPHMVGIVFSSLSPPGVRDIIFDHTGLAPRLFIFLTLNSPVAYEYSDGRLPPDYEVSRARRFCPLVSLEALILRLLLYWEANPISLLID
ncbi:hypothetical protein Tco_0230874 [Tanacetum coccineum]